MARDAIYPKQLIAPVPRGILNLTDADYRVRQSFDIIFCRNALIYFDRPRQQAVIGKLCRNLNPNV